MAYTPVSLGDVIQQGEAIKGQRQRSLLADLQIKQARDQEAKSSALDTILQSNPNATSAELIKAGGASAIPVAAQQQQLTAQADEQTYRKLYAAAGEVTVAKDPIAAVRNAHPEFIKQFESQNGAGSFDKLSPDQVRQMAAGLRDHAQQLLVDPKTQFQVAHEDQRAANTQAGSDARSQATIDAAAKQGALNRGVTIRGQDLANADRGIPTGYERDPAKPGSLRPIAGGPHDPSTPKPPGEADKKNAVLFDSMMNSEKSIQALTSAPGGATDTSSKWNAFLGGVPGGAAKWMQTDAYRKYEAAGLRWAANLLYLKSGATANPDEIRSTWKQFFPQPNEGQDNAALKEQARRQEIESVRKNMVPGAAPLPAASNAGWSVQKVQ